MPEFEPTVAMFSVIMAAVFFFAPSLARLWMKIRAANQRMLLRRGLPDLDVQHHITVTEHSVRSVIRWSAAINCIAALLLAYGIPKWIHRQPATSSHEKLPMPK